MVQEMGIIDFVQRNWRWLGFLALMALVWVFVVNPLMPEVPAGTFNVKIVWVCLHVAASFAVSVATVLAVAAFIKWLS